METLPSRRILETLRESPKRIILVSGGLGSLQMVSKSDTGRCVSEEIEPRRGVDCEIPNPVGEENETFFIRLWKPLSSIRVLKTLRGSPKGKAQRGQYRLAMGFIHYS